MLYEQGHYDPNNQTDRLLYTVLQYIHYRNENGNHGNKMENKTYVHCTDVLVKQKL